jgi:hypothetical protein
MKADISHILAEIPELSYVDITAKRVRYIAPRQHLSETRSFPVLSYLRRVAECGRLAGEFFLCLYDGWREYSKPVENPVFVPWDSLDLGQFTGPGSKGEPRFIHSYSDDIFPVLPLPVLTFCRHKGDVNALLIPDPQYLRSQFGNYRKEVELHDIAWSSKSGSTLFWRGSRRKTSYQGQVEPHPREFITSRYSPFVDAHYSTHTPIAAQLAHKFLVDVDGMVNAWSGLFWKLSSNSLPIKIKSHWEQWYYPMLCDGKNIILSDLGLEQTYRRLAADDELACEIAHAGKELVSRLTFQYACEEYIIA